MTTDMQAPADRRRTGRRPDDFVSLFPELYRSAFTAAHSELGSRAAAEEVTHATLARAHARWSRIGDSPVGWVSTAARTHALDVLQRQPPGREVLVDGEAELPPGEIPTPDSADLASVTRRGNWLRRKRAAGWAAAGVSAVAAAVLAVGLGTWMPPARGADAELPPTVSQNWTDYSPIGSSGRPDPGLLFGRISAGRSEQGSVRVTFEAGDGRSVEGPQQLVIDPSASLESRDYTHAGRPVVTRTPEELIQHLNRATPGGQALVWLRLGPDGKISALREV